MYLAHSKLTDNVYVIHEKKKTNVTQDFIHCAMSRWKGFVETITDKETGEKFEISIRKVGAFPDAKLNKTANRD